MQITSEKPGQTALAIDRSAAILGLDEFSLLSRIQTGEISAVRGHLGEMLISENELERAAGYGLNIESGQKRISILPDDCLGIELRASGLKRAGKPLTRYVVKGVEGRFSEDEIKSYRVAASAIAKQLEVVRDLNQQLTRDGQVPESCDFELNTPQTGHWEVRTGLLNFDLGEIVLCQRGHEYAVIERFHENSPYALANGSAEILMQGNDPHQLMEAFKSDAKLTLEFMASNLAAKAQTIVWDQYPDQRAGEVVAAISQRCYQATANEQAISQSQNIDQHISRGIRM